MDSKLIVKVVGEAFMDDSFLGCTSEYQIDPALTERLAEQDTINKLQCLAQQWERLLYATGGAISLSKSFWYLISWKWSKSGHARLTIFMAVVWITVRESTGGLDSPQPSGMENLLRLSNPHSAYTNPSRLGKTQTTFKTFNISHAPQ
jgi:hypothetical protein